jgi:hypothetical protein
MPPPRYDWNAVQRYYDEGHGFVECRRRFGFTHTAWNKAIKRQAITLTESNFPNRRRRYDWPKLPLEVLMARSKSRLSIKRRLLDAGILESRCDECGISEWRGRHLSIQLDHRNGIRDDHRLENLRMLCPNCHSQTETFAAKNKSNKLAVINS